MLQQRRFIYEVQGKMNGEEEVTSGIILGDQPPNQDGTGRIRRRDG